MQAFVSMKADLTDVIRHPAGTSMEEAVKSRASVMERHEYRLLVTFGTDESIWTISGDGTLRMPGNMTRARRAEILKKAKEVL